MNDTDGKFFWPFVVCSGLGSFRDAIFRPDNDDSSIFLVKCKTFFPYHVLAYHYIGRSLAIPEMEGQLNMLQEAKFKMVLTMHKPFK